MKTILQKIGPLYGEVANGTVFGQPNGSDAVLSLDITLSNVDSTAAYVTKPYAIKTCKADGTLAPYCDISFTSPVPVMVRRALYSNSACTVLVSETTRGPPALAGTLVLAEFSVFNIGTITPGTTYYGRVELIADGKVVKATSAITFTGV